MHSFIQGRCRECSLSWKLHKGAIDDELCKKLYDDEQKREAGEQAKAAAKAALVENTFENRRKKMRSIAMNKMPEDDWYNDEEGESTRASLLDDEDDKFTMQVIEQSITQAKQPLKGVKVRNLVEDFDVMAGTTPSSGKGRNTETALPSPDSFSSAPASIDAPVGVSGDLLALRLEEIKRHERNRKEAEDFRQRLEFTNIEVDVLRGEVKEEVRKEQSAKLELESVRREIADMKVTFLQVYKNADKDRAERKLEKENQGKLLAALAERDSEIKALREQTDMVNWRRTNSTAQSNATLGFGSGCLGGSPDNVETTRPATRPYSISDFVLRVARFCNL